MINQNKNTMSRPTRIRYGVLLFACSLSLLAYLDRVCISRVAKYIQADLQITDEMMGFVFSAFIFGYAIFEVPGGMIGDRWGTRLALTRVVSWWSLFTCLTGSIWYFSINSGSKLNIFNWEIPILFDSFLLMVLVRFVFGAGEAGAYPNISRAVGFWFPYRERGFAQGCVWMCARLGGAIAPFVIGRLTSVMGWRNAFWVLGGLGFAWAIGFYTWFREHPEDNPSCNQAERNLIRGQVDTAISSATSSSGHNHSWPPMMPMIRSLSMWALCGVSFGVSFGWYFYPTWQPKFFKDVYNLDYENTEILTGLPFIAGAIGCLFGGKLSDYFLKLTGSKRWSRSLVGAFGFGGAAICFFLAGRVPAAWQAITLLCLAALLNDLAIPNIWVVSADLGGRFVGTVSGFMNMIGLLGGVFSPILIPRALRMLSDQPADERWRLILSILAMGWFFSAGLWLIIDSSRPLYPQEESSQPPT